MDKKYRKSYKYHHNNYNASERHTYFSKRYSFHEAADNSLLTIKWDGSDVGQCRMDPNIYEYHGRPWSRSFEREYEFHTGTDGLVMEHGILIIDGFDSFYQNWLRNKQYDFERAVQRLECGFTGSISGFNIYGGNQPGLCTACARRMSGRR